MGIIYVRVYFGSIPNKNIFVHVLSLGQHIFAFLGFQVSLVKELNFFFFFPPGISLVISLLLPEVQWIVDSAVSVEGRSDWDITPFCFLIWNM